MGSQTVNDDDPIKVQDIVLEPSDICKVDEKKRSGTVHKLGYESFKTNIYKDKQAGFVTKRPLDWFNGLKQYFLSYEINNRCQKSTRIVNKVNKVSICKIRFVSSGTKELTIQMNFVTGVFNVKGPTYSEWIQTEFEKLKTFVPPHKTDESNLTVETGNTTDGEVEEKEVADKAEEEEKEVADKAVEETTDDDLSSEIKKIWKYVRDMKSQDTNTQSEIKEIWNNINELKNAFGTIEESIADVSSRIESNSESVNDRFSQLDRKMKELEQRVEDKIVIYQAVNDEALDKRCSKITTDLNNKINSLKQVNKSFKEDIDRKVENISGGPSGDQDHSIEIAEIRKMIDAIDIPLLEKDIQKTTEGYDYAVSAIHEKINKLGAKCSEDIGSNEITIRLTRSDLNDVKSQSKAMSESIEGIRAELLCHSKAWNEHPRSNGHENPASVLADRVPANWQHLSLSATSENASYHPPAPKVPLRSTEALPRDTVPRTNTPPLHGGREDTPKQPITDTITELVIVMDSNARYIDFKKLWTLKGTDIQRKGNIRELNEVIDAKNYTNLKYFFFSIGCNDVESSSGEEVFKGIQTTVEKIKTRYPGVKVIASEITPRLDEFDIHVKDCNKLLNNYVTDSDNVYIARHSNLRDPTFFHVDKKHLHQRAIGRFASNIKWALRRAYGINRSFQTARDYTNDHGERNSNGYNENRIRRYSNGYNGNRTSGYSNGLNDNRTSHSSNPQKSWNYVPMPNENELMELLRKLCHK